MQTNENHDSAAKIVLLVILLVIAGALGALLLHNRHAAPTVPEAQQPAAETTLLPAQTAVTTGAATTAETVTTTAVTELTPRAQLLQYLQTELLGESDPADDSAAKNTGSLTGIAGAYIADFRNTGTEDLLVIRLEILDESHAPAPVFDWYALQNGTVALLDSFSCKMPWSELALRYSQQTLYVSACDIPQDDAQHADSRKYTEITIGMQNGDLQTLNMEQDYGEQNRPKSAAPADAALLLTVEPDRALLDGALPARTYLLCDYTGMRELLAQS